MSPRHPVAPERSPVLPPDRVVSVLATGDYQIHQLVYAAFACGGTRRFVFRALAISGREYRVRVRPSDIETRFTDGQAFDLDLRALPTVKVAGKRRSIGRAPAKDSLRLRWIRSRSREHGFTLRSIPELRVERIRLDAAKIPFGVTVCTYRAQVRVTDAARFARAYTRGIGQGRAWGCGMMILSEPAGHKP